MVSRTEYRRVEMNSRLFRSPHESVSNIDNEFGLGYYTAKDLTHSLHYLNGGYGRVGAIMVFRDPAL